MIFVLQWPPEVLLLRRLVWERQTPLDYSLCYFCPLVRQPGVIQKASYWAYKAQAPKVPPCCSLILAVETPTSSEKNITHTRNFFIIWCDHRARYQKINLCSSELWRSVFFPASLEIVHTRRTVGKVFNSRWWSENPMTKSVAVKKERDFTLGLNHSMNYWSP